MIGLKKVLPAVQFLVLIALWLVGCTGGVHPIGYSVSGVVVDKDGNGIKNVTLKFSGGFGTVKTDASGGWNKGDLRGTVVITPQKDGWIFSTRRVSKADSEVVFNGEAVSRAKTFEATGRVVDPEGKGVPGITINFNGFTPVETGKEGQWAKPGLSGDVVVKPVKQGWVFDPADAIISYGHPFHNFHARKMVGGILWTDTTWTESDSPIIFHSNVQIAPGATLTIKPGVVVKGNGYSLDVFGNLTAVGNKISRCIFKDVALTPGGDFVTGISNTSRIEWAEFKGASIYSPSGGAYMGSLILRDSVIIDSTGYDVAQLAVEIEVAVPGPLWHNGFR